MSKDRKDKVGGKPDGTTQTGEGLKRRDLLLSGTSLLAASALAGAGLATPAQAQQPTAASPSGQQPNIVFIMGDDIGWFNIGAYHQGIMAGRTPNLDQLSAEGMRLPTTTPKRAARPVVPTSSPVSSRSVRG